MTRDEFERLRDLPGKVIVGDIRLASQRDLSTLLVADKIKIDNADDVDARLTMDFNPETGAKCINVHVSGVGPICRLEVDSRAHKPHGRSHKHALDTSECPSENLKRKVIDFGQLSGKDIREVFGEFCKMAKIQHNGQLIIPANGQ